MTSYIHDGRLRKVRDLPIKQPFILNIHIKLYHCLNCFDVFSQSFGSIQPNKHLREYLFYELCKDTMIQDISKEQMISYT
jgi:hypothetical protein